jgi:hypothetical protein
MLKIVAVEFDKRFKKVQSDIPGPTSQNAKPRV